jgi:colanic acid/amylovoran biosynthesis glycosyltransferase
MPATTVLGCHLLTDIPFSIGAHAYDVFRDRGDWLLPLKLSRARFVRTSSESTAQRLRKLGLENQKLRLIHRSLKPTVDRGSFELVNPSFLTLLSVGRLVEKKGYFLLLQILSEIKRKEIPFEMNIIGGGPLKNALEREILRLRLGNNLFLHDHLNESAIDKFYQTSDAFLFTGVVCANGDRDGIPNVIPEAMSHGLLVMGSNQAGASEAFADWESGYSLDPYQKEPWVHILHQFYQHPEKFTAMRKLARSRAQTLFSAEQNCQKFKNLFY